MAFRDAELPFCFAPIDRKALKLAMLLDPYILCSQHSKASSKCQVAYITRFIDSLYSFAA